MTDTRSVPRLPARDSTLALLADPYRFLGRQAAALSSDVFEAGIFLQPTLCLTGTEAASLFYDNTRFIRHNAAPEPLVATLFGRGGVQALDDAAHRHRKALFLDVLRPERQLRLVELVRREWQAALHDWTLSPPFPLYAALQPILTRAVCQWAGVPLADDDVPARSRQLVRLFDSAASGPVRHVLARRARHQTEAWLTRLIEAARRGHTRLSVDTAAHAVSTHVDMEGRPLPVGVAAVELLNVLRPVVAVSVYMTFVAHALHAHREWRQRLGSEPDPRAAMAFVQEVRRHYPFFPAVAARVRTDFAWQGMSFRAGQRALFDLYGTNHDARAWPGPDTFSPERWLDGTIDPRAFVPQGGGDVALQHRCPGEDTAGRLMRLALDILLQSLRYEVPSSQRLAPDLSRLPAVPRDGFVIERVRRIA